jgi:ABC-type Fe3+-citrate transport system substrate-binding protein
MNLKALKKHRERLNHKYSSIQVDIHDLIIVKGSSDTVRVSFKQRYQVDGYHDFGLKKINLVKKGKYWKIKNEEWLPLDRKSLL